MPGVDVSLEQLRQYLGRDPMPEHFEFFWEKSKQKVSAFSLRIEEEAVEYENPKLSYFRITIQATDQVWLRAKYIRPKKKTQVPMVIAFHDYPGASRGWFHLSRYGALGFGVLAPDARGQGGMSESGQSGVGTTAGSLLFQGLSDIPENMYLYHLMEDSFLWIEVAERLSDVDDGSLYVYGEGQGGGQAIACAALYPEIEKCIAHYPMLCDYKRVWEMDFDTNGYEGLTYFFRWHDPEHKREKEIFEKLALMDVKNFASMVKAKVLMSTGLRDFVSPPSAQFAVFHALACEKRHLVYPKHGHELNNFFENEYLKFLLEK